MIPACDLDSPDGRPAQFSDQGSVVVGPAVNGLHDHYKRRAAQGFDMKWVFGRHMVGLCANRHLKCGFAR